MRQFGVGCEPFFHGLDGGFATEGRLGKLMVVQEDISMQGLRQVFSRTAMVVLQDITDISIETFHHAVGLWGSGLGDLDRAGLVQRLQECPGGGRRFVGLDCDVHPSDGVVDGHEEIATGGFVCHLRQVFDVHVQVTRHVGLEGLMDHLLG